MPPEESPEAKFDRLKKRVQETVLRDYPNPERKGCPGDAVLRGLARRSLREAVESDRHWHHVTHCSECYGEFLQLNQTFRGARTVTRARLVWGSALVVGAVAIALAVSVWNGQILKRPQNAELAYEKRTVVIPSALRSPGAEEPKPITLDRLPVDLTVELPVGSRAGFYELQLKKDDRPILSGGGNAEIHNGNTKFTVRMNLSELKPGSYAMEVRQVPFDWSFYPVLLR